MSLEKNLVWLVLQRGFHFHTPTTTTPNNRKGTGGLLDGFKLMCAPCFSPITHDIFVYVVINLGKYTLLSSVKFSTGSKIERRLKTTGPVKNS